MNKYDLISKLERVAPLDTQEEWDCSGWIVDNDVIEVDNIMLALTITDDIIKQAREKKCNLIISHHPLFKVPIDYKDINIYASHTPLDKMNGGTTDTLIENLQFQNSRIINDFVRIVDIEITVEELKNKLASISKNLRTVNNQNIQNLKSIAFCAGSGSEFINTTEADAYVTGDIKFHTAIEASKVLFDIGHFESEIFILKKIQKILNTEVYYANEKTPFI